MPITPRKKRRKYGASRLWTEGAVSLIYAIVVGATTLADEQKHLSVILGQDELWATSVLNYPRLSVAHLPHKLSTGDSNFSFHDPTSRQFFQSKTGLVKTAGTSPIKLPVSGRWGQRKWDPFLYHFPLLLLSKGTMGVWKGGQKKNLNVNFKFTFWVQMTSAKQNCKCMLYNCLCLETWKVLQCKMSQMKSVQCLLWV